MIPAYKAMLFTSFGCSFYMMTRLFTVSPLGPSIISSVLTRF
jgi:hypothetical protein